ncbi:hypothetical protein GCM10010449_14760 [Streptomyces rectiviolaceus]|uniref:Uncharacterized protein n=1 Tax=Streptomyces rectiviolaceus TaxID=332591 RepID=A0ABP6M9Q6_9ACTN
MLMRTPGSRTGGRLRRRRDSNPRTGKGKARPAPVSRRGRGFSHADRNGPLCHGSATCGTARSRSGEDRDSALWGASSFLGCGAAALALALALALTCGIDP